MSLYQKPRNIKVGVMTNLSEPHWPERAPTPDALPEHQAPLLEQPDLLPGPPDPLQERPDPFPERTDPLSQHQNP